MKRFLIWIFFVSLFTLSFSQSKSFLSQQKTYARVRLALEEKGDIVNRNLSENNFKTNNLNVLFVAYKGEKDFEIYAKSKTETTYKKIATYNICKLSGVLGPKQKEGDYQVPEGFYYINNFNPSSLYYLSLGINYPNQSDKIKSTFPRLGGDIFIHGKCVTIGCLPMTDDKIKEIYLYALFAKASGQNKIPVYIFPFRMINENLKKYQQSYPQWKDFWNNLKKGYDIFQKEKKELKFSVDKQGNYIF
ncbi:conserved exported hypothetical protein [uncultured Paludibacter sp.]|uniref:L,D-TPase catalytic domain-containing protein n=1 Tax=uncultured Paludibacter sp. TaxID=497635 RepID=A0A653AGU3_9BACT|nr:conserved exported hypothetical protein [uncultured Paludibacter sp.]